MDIRNKEIRKRLIARYLDAETTPVEERMLADYYLVNTDIDEGEKDVAKLIRMENIYASFLSDEGVEEFDRIINETKQKSIRIPLRWMVWTGAIAASIALFFVVSPLLNPKTPETVEIAENIQQIMDLGMDEVLSITATPVDDFVWVKAVMKNGTTKTFIMSEDKKTGATSLLSIN